MATTQTLQKKLRSVQSIQKVSKALKTAATVKFSRLSAAYGNYAPYAKQCRRLYEDNRALFERALPKTDPQAPVCFLILAGNKGMCGSFHSDLLGFALEQLEGEKHRRVILVGRWLKNRFEESGLGYDRAFSFSDVPTYADTVALYEYVQGLLTQGKASRIELIYPKYRNMMKQTPVRRTLSGKAPENPIPTEPLFFPDRESVVQGMANGVMISFLHEKMLESAMGAQAATLMTMRSAHDTATEYGRQLEGEINQKRQSRVTADVIETSSEFSREVD